MCLQVIDFIKLLMGLISIVILIEGSTSVCKTDRGASTSDPAMAANVDELEKGQVQFVDKRKRISSKISESLKIKRVKFSLVSDSAVLEDPVSEALAAALGAGISSPKENAVGEPVDNTPQPASDESAPSVDTTVGGTQP